MTMGTTAAVRTEEPKTYDDKIVACYQYLCSKQSDGASPAEVTAEMHRRGWISPMDTVIDIEKLMRRLRHEEGRL